MEINLVTNVDNPNTIHNYLIFGIGYRSGIWLPLPLSKGFPNKGAGTCTRKNVKVNNPVPAGAERFSQRRSESEQGHKSCMSPYGLLKMCPLRSETQLDRNNWSCFKPVLKLSMISKCDKLVCLFPVFRSKTAETVPKQSF